MDQSITDNFLIAAIGASAGGLEALEQFFRHTPADTGIAFIVVQHLAPDHESALAQLLAKYTSMPVEQVRDKTRVLQDRVCIIPPNATLTIQDGVLHVAAPAEPRGRRTPIDSLFSSLAQDHGENAVCIVLSGTGTDGTRGLMAIKEHGGMAMAQTIESARYDAILRSAISTGLVDHVLRVEEMPAKLMEYAAHLGSIDASPPVSGSIHIRALRTNGLREFSVTDNGIGIEAVHLTTIFAPFKRLHALSKYPGSGLGLAICQKIVEGLGGQIWAESSYGKGSTFHFTIPATEGDS